MNRTRRKATVYAEYVRGIANFMYTIIEWTGYKCVPTPVLRYPAI